MRADDYQESTPSFLREETKTGVFKIQVVLCVASESAASLSADYLSPSLPPSLSRQCRRPREVHSALLRWRDQVRGVSADHPRTRSTRLKNNP